MKGESRALVTVYAEDGEVGRLIHVENIDINGD